jgi:hypothetical protein
MKQHNIGGVPIAIQFLLNSNATVKDCQRKFKPIMIGSLRKAINYMANKPKTLFLTDSLGAMVTAFLLFVVLRRFNEYIGMPKTILVYLSVIAVSFCTYSTICFLFLKRNWIPFIRAISYVNLLYCVLTIGLLISYHSVLTTLGIIYFLVEIAIICVLVYIELTVAATIKAWDIH